MAAIQRLFDYKATVANKIVTNDSILKAIIDNNTDFLSNDLPSGYDGDDLIYKQIFPYLPVTSQFTEDKNYIVISLGRFQSNGVEYVDGSISITALCPYSFIKTDSGQRHGFIADKIDEMMTNSRGFGLGKIGKKTIEEMVIGSSSNYIGISMRYYFTDFARS